MKIKADNAVILAAGFGSRMRPLTDIMPKSLIAVKGEKLIERLIRQLKEIGLPEIAIVVGYKAEKFKYLEEKYGVKLLYNPEYQTRNTWYSLYTARDYLKNSYVCSADYYYFENPFKGYEPHAYFETVPPKTEGAVMGVTSDKDGLIISSSVPAESNQWLEYGHCFFDEAFSRKFVSFLEEICSEPDRYGEYWETIYRNHIDELKIYEKRIDPACLAELDTPSELEAFDKDWKKNNTWAKELKLQ